MTENKDKNRQILDDFIAKNIGHLPLNRKIIHSIFILTSLYEAFCEEAAVSFLSEFCGLQLCPYLRRTCWFLFSFLCESIPLCF